MEREISVLQTTEVFRVSCHGHDSLLYKVFDRLRGSQVDPKRFGVAQKWWQS